MDTEQITGVRTFNGDLLRADHVILSAGIGTPALLQSSGQTQDLLPRPGQILRTQPVRFRLNQILVTPTQEIRQLPDGSLLTPCAANHQADTSSQIPDPDAAAKATLAHLTDIFGPAVQAATTLAYRPVPANGLPILGQVAEGLSVAVMHSGITLAPFAAEALTAQIMGTAPDPLWAAYAPNGRIQKR